MSTMPHKEEPVKAGADPEPVDRNADGGEGKSIEVPAEVLFDDLTVAATGRFAGHFEPIDGRHHWSGRLAPNADLAAHVRAGRREVRIRTSGDPVPARLAEVDPWGGIRVTGLGRPPG